jgi:hypothetical protein
LEDEDIKIKKLKELLEPPTKEQQQWREKAKKLIASFYPQAFQDENGKEVLLDIEKEELEQWSEKMDAWFKAR